MSSDFELDSLGLPSENLHLSRALRAVYALQNLCHRLGVDYSHLSEILLLLLLLLLLLGIFSRMSECGQQRLNQRGSCSRKQTVPKSPDTIMLAAITRAHTIQ
jgi:hypothetical protein